jgi:hypothetical protein
MKRMIRRLEFSAETKRDAFARSGGFCECYLVLWLGRPGGCGGKLSGGNVFYAHITPDAIRQDNSLANCAVLSKTCWREKTSGYDLPVIAKSNRVRDRHIGAISLPRQIIPGSTASPWKHRVSGGWTRR